MSEFVLAQIEKLEPWEKNRAASQRSRRAKLHPVDTSLHLDDHRYVAWTMHGHLVVIDDPVPGEFRSSPIVRLLTNEERRDVLGANRLVSIVVAVTGVEHGPSSCYFPHCDLRGALEAALARARQSELEVARVAADQAFVAGEQPVAAVCHETGMGAPKPKRRGAKSRFHALGNYVLLRSPHHDEVLPPFAGVLFGTPVPEAFPDRRTAERHLASSVHRGESMDDFGAARVLGVVKVRPRFRDDITVPNEPEAVLNLIQQHPDVVLPLLGVAWLPRYFQDAAGMWRPEVFRHQKRTVRHALYAARVTSVATVAREFGSKLKFAERKETRGAKRASYATFVRAMDELTQEAMALKAFAVEERPAVTGARYTTLHRAQRLLPSAWLTRVGLDPFDHPNLRSVLESPLTPPPFEAGHWLRAPFEFKAAGDSRPRWRIVEQRIDDLSSLLQFGMEIEFWLIKDSTRKDPRWVMPIRAWAVRSQAG